MWGLVVIALIGAAILVVSTDQFVTGASRVASGLNLSSVLVGAVILGCGTGLPELALAFHRERVSWKELFHANSGGGETAIFVFLLVLVVVLTLPVLIPHISHRHSPLIVFSTVAFAALLRGSLSRLEGVAMLAGFVVGIAWIVYASRDNTFDAFAPLIDDDYQAHGVYIEAPVLTPVQLDATRLMIGLVGTGVGAQMLGRSVGSIMSHHGADVLVTSAVVAVLASVLPHVVVAVQALKQHHEGLAIGNLIGSNLFHSLAIGGLVAIIRPYDLGSPEIAKLLGVSASTALLTYMLLRTEDELSRKEGFAFLGAYIVLVTLAVR